MTLKTQSFLARIMMYRPDLIGEEGTQFGIWAIQETVRTICRRAAGLNVDQQPVSILPANSHSITISSINNEITTLQRVRVADIPGTDVNPSQYLGTFDSTTGAITPTYGAITSITALNAGSFPLYSFFLCSAAGGPLLVDNVNVYAWSVGDVIYCNGTSWLQVRLDQFVTLNINSKKMLDFYYDRNQESRELPTSCAREGNQLYFYAPTRYTTAFQMDVSVVPNLMNWNLSTPQPVELDDIPLPVEAEGAIIAGALEMLFRAPYRGSDKTTTKQNMMMAEKYGREFKRELTNLRSIGSFGQSGPAFYNPGNWTGRQPTFRHWTTKI